MRKRYWLIVVLGGFAVYTGIAVLGTLSAFMYFRSAHQSIDWPSFLANRYLEQWTCALFVAPLFWLVDRYPLTHGRWRGNATVLFAAVILFVVVKYIIMQPLHALWTGHPGDPLQLAILDNVVPVSFDFFAIIGVAHALRYNRLVRERERTAAELKTQLVQARLDVLRGQLHPHFIFNTLNAAATLVHEDPGAADRMLTQLGDLLRLSLERGESEVPLSEELALAGRYLDIMRYRFSDRLTVRSRAEDAVRSALVPTFILQPLIENALEHGIARRPGPGSVDITARGVGDAVEITVADDGPGFAGDASTGIGLSNTVARLEQLYGAAATMRTESTAVGARVIVRIPIRECTTS